MAYTDWVEDEKSDEHKAKLQLLEKNLFLARQKLTAIDLYNKTFRYIK